MSIVTLGERLRLLREKKGLTQVALAKKLNIPNQNVSNYERDFRQPDYETLKKLADLYEVTTDYLLGHSNRQTSSNKPTLDDLDMKENENLFFFNRDGMSDEDVEKVKEYIELLRLKAKQYNEKHNK